MSNIVKQVIVIRKDLKMRRGKEIAQASHASMAFLLNQLEGGIESQTIKLDVPTLGWKETGHTKIGLRVDSEQELVDLHEAALASGLKSHLITDNGLTEFDGVKTKTALAIGPDYSVLIDKITSNLKLY
jgi:PTH2 family peptidyl-tRNA hydrolase|tara:strand:- start:112 stop:498 length:387 start_codon:yes stop_codon:yes gene_type:complete